MGISIAEILGEAEANKLHDLTIRVGGVYVANFVPSDGMVPKNHGDKSRDKMFIVLGRDEAYVYGCVIINSDVNKGSLTKEAQDAQYLLMGHKYKGVFANAYSYVDCHKIFPITIKKIKTARLLCLLNEEDLSLIFETVRDNAPKAELRRYGI